MPVWDTPFIAFLAQLVERVTSNDEVIRSNRVEGIGKFYFFLIGVTICPRRYPKDALSPHTFNLQPKCPNPPTQSTRKADSLFLPSPLHPMAPPSSPFPNSKN